VLGIFPWPTLLPPQLLNTLTYPTAHPHIDSMPRQVAPGPGVPANSVGGFGHTQRAGAGQRVDVTGHVCCAFVKLLEVLEAHPGGPEAAPEE
jgi:hypothetical protein